MSHPFLVPNRPTRRLSVPKICGADVELGNFVLGLAGIRNTGAVASRALLREIAGFPEDPPRHACDSYGPSASCTSRSVSVAGESAEWWDGAGWTSVAGGNGDGYSDGQSGWGSPGGASDPQDWGRRFLPCNGGCAYIDLNHLEICLPEVRSARDHVAAWHAMLRVVRKALGKANGRLPDGQRIQVLVNNSDGVGHSYGSHLDILITRTAWDNLFSRKMHHMLFLAAYQVSSVIFTGQGKVGNENGTPPVDFQLSQRADFFETLTGIQTTFHRPIVNSRDEPLCGAGSRANDDLARLHVIFYDSNLAPVACFLKVGVLQIILSMIEAERVNPDLALDDPVDAVVRFSHDPNLEARASTVGGRELTALELQFLFLEEAERFVESGACAEQVPGCDEIVGLWRDTLEKLQARDLSALARRLDWVLKRTLLRQVISRHPDLCWRSAEIKHLDQIFGGLSLSEGLYWAYERNGFVERIVPEERIRWLTRRPPDDTRAWTRAMLLRRWGRSAESVDWDRIRFRTGRDGLTTTDRTVDLTDPADFTRDRMDPVFRDSHSLDDVLDILGATREERSTAEVESVTSWS